MDFGSVGLYQTYEVRNRNSTADLSCCGMVWRPTRRDGRAHTQHENGRHPHAFTRLFTIMAILAMPAAMRAYKDIGFDGPIRPDHVSVLEGDTEDRSVYDFRIHDARSLACHRLHERAHGIGRRGVKAGQVTAFPSEADYVAWDGRFKRSPPIASVQAARNTSSSSAIARRFQGCGRIKLQWRRRTRDWKLETAVLRF